MQPAYVIGAGSSVSLLSGTIAQDRVLHRKIRERIWRGIALLHQMPLLCVLGILFALQASLGCRLFTNETGKESEEGQLATLRLQMVEKQLHQRRIDDERVLKAMETIPRHLFVPPSLRFNAYDDRPLPIGEEQTISQPYIVALMSESLRLTGEETVLEIGTGSGYQAAVLSVLAKRVYSIEIIPQLAETARQRLTTLGYTNVTVIVGDGNKGWATGGPYDAIMVTAAAPQVPEALVAQLAEGGRLVVPLVIGEEQHLLRLSKHKGHLKREDLGLVRFVPLVEGNE
jgi:protein-L-isoaspartate(D-aspartate) O-methyltransferase